MKKKTGKKIIERIHKPYIFNAEKMRKRDKIIGFFEGSKE
jgi:hypothetical protein